MILVTGATGTNGVELIKLLAQRKAAVRAMSRKLRDSDLFMQGLLAFASSIASEGRFYAAIGDARVSIVDVRDIAAVAAAALTESGHEGKAYDITGPNSTKSGTKRA